MNKIKINQNDDENIVYKRGFKGFNYNWTDLESGRQYEVGQTYHVNDESINLSERPPYSGFIFAPDFFTIQHVYDITYPQQCRYAIIEYDSRVKKVKYSEDSNSLTYRGMAATTSIRIVRELFEWEISKLLKECRGPKVWRNATTKKLHSHQDRPAVITYFSNGNISQKRWYKDDVLHRQNPDLPAIIQYNDKGDQKVFQSYYQNGIYERPNSLGNFWRSTPEPACIFYDNRGSLKKYIYYENGEIVKIVNNPKPKNIPKGGIFLLLEMDAQNKYIMS